MYAEPAAIAVYYSVDPSLGSNDKLWGSRVDEKSWSLSFGTASKLALW